MVEILLMVWIFLASFGSGAFFLRLFPNSYFMLDHFVFSTGLGFGSITLIMMILGFLGLWYTPVIYILLIILTLIGLANIKSLIGRIRYQDIKRTWGSCSKFSVLIGLILLGHVLVNLIGDLAPPVNGDTIGGYLVWPKLWVQNHGIYEIHDRPWSFMPANTQMLSSLGLLLKNDALSQLLVGFLMSVLGCLTVYGIARKHFANEASLLAAAIFYCTPVIIWLSYSAKVDLVMAFFELLALYAFVNFFYEEDEKRAFNWVLLSAVFCGFSIGTKLFAFSSVIIGFGVVIRYFKTENTKKNLRKHVKYVIGFASVAAVFGAPWYIRNMISQGNPIYPLLSETMNVASLFVERSEGRGLLGYLSTFWLWSIHRPQMGASIGPIFIFSIPCLLFMGKIDRHIKPLLIIVFAYSMLCYMTVARPRHMLAGIGLLSIIAGCAIIKVRDTQKILKHGVTVIVIGMFLFNLSLDIWRNLLVTPKIPYIFGSINREAFLRMTFTKSRTLPYAMMQFINNKLPYNARILIVGVFSAYYIDRTTLNGWDCVLLKNEAEVEPYLLKKGVTHIFVNPDVSVKGKNVHIEYTSDRLFEQDYLSVFRKAFYNSPLFSESFARQHLKLVFSHSGKYLFEWISKS